MDENQSKSDARDLTAEIVASYVANNSVRSSDLAELIASVYGALTGLGQAAADPVAEPLVPPVSVRKSLQNDYLISMEDGKQYQSLKRHLAGRGLTPADYRAKWGLPIGYPMVAPAYSERRSALAKSLGLGRKSSRSVAADSGMTDQDEAGAAPNPPRSRKKAA